MHWRHATLLAAVSVAASHATATMTSRTSTAGSGSAAASALPPRAPGQAHNLTGWQLDTCLHSPRSVKAPALATYTDPNFFLGDDDTIVMLTPDNATAVTAHTDHPRTEFRETGVADWELDSGEHVLSLLTAVLRVSSTNNETIIAQIHGSVNEEIAKVIKLRWTNGRVEARVKNHTAPHDEFGLDCGTYALGTPLSVEVRVAAGILAVEVNGKGITYKPPFNPADRFYFKAGDYNQCEPCGRAGQFAEVHLAKLSTSHNSTRTINPHRLATRGNWTPSTTRTSSAGSQQIASGRLRWQH